MGTMAHLSLTFHSWHCYVPHFCLNYTCNVCHDTKDLVFPQQYLLSSMINWSPWHWHLLHLSDHNHVIHVSQVNQTSTLYPEHQNKPSFEDACIRLDGKQRRNMLPPFIIQGRGLILEYIVVWENILDEHWTTNLYYISGCFFSVAG